MRRVVITGMGCISPLGIGVAPTWDALKAGQSGIDYITRFDTTDFPVKIGGEVKGFDAGRYVDAKEAKRMDPNVQYAVAAALEAVADAALSISESNRDSVGVVIGSGIGGIMTFENEHRRLLERGPSRVSAFFIPMMIGNMAAAHVAMELKAKGPNAGMVTACASSAHAIALGYRLVSTGEATAMIVGGTEAAITPMGLAGFSNMKALSRHDGDPKAACRPLDANRDGFVMGEGAGVVIIESMEEAERRGARAYCELGGYGMSGDAYHVTQSDPEGDGAKRAIRACLACAGVQPEQVDYANAHAPATLVGDESEALAIHGVFGDHAKRLLVSSTKSMHGHLLGAAGAIELIACVLAIRDGIVPPTLNHEVPDPACQGLDCVPKKARQHPVRVAVSNSFGFGGQNATLLVRAL